MKKILILSDSLALPRIKPEICDFQDTYPILLKKKYEVHQVSIGGATSDVLLKQVHYHKSFNPDIVILQVGIVDCAPRFMTRREIDFTYDLGSIGKTLRRLFNRKLVKKYRNISYVTEFQFEKNLTQIKTKFDCPVIAINIVPAGEDYEILLPGVKMKISRYNKIIKKNFELIIDSKGIIENGVMTDFHHINKKGHLLLMHEIENILDKR